jgi:L-aminoadipate-semialdehyde dehydrogenase
MLCKFSIPYLASFSSFLSFWQYLPRQCDVRYFLLTDAHIRMPLYHFATTDLPADTIAPEMSDVNAEISLLADKRFTGEDLSAGAGASIEILGNYLAYLISIGFLPRPDRVGERAVPNIEVREQQREALLRVGGRGALV